MEVIGAFPLAERQTAIAELERMAPWLAKDPAARTLWTALRNLLHHHRSFPEAEWALPDADVDRLSAVYTAVEPSNCVDRHSWVFSSWPRLPDGDRTDHRRYEEQIRAAREAAVREILPVLGIDGLFALAKEVEAPWAIGVSAAPALDEGQIDRVLDRTFANREAGAEQMALALCGAVQRQQGWNGFERILNHAMTLGGSPQVIALLFYAAPSEPETWDRVEAAGEEIAHLYWSGVRNAHAIEHRTEGSLTRAATALLNAENALAAHDLLSFATEGVSDDLIVRTLELLPDALERARQDGDARRVDAYRTARLFAKLDRAGIARELIARLEIPFLGLLEEHRDDLALHREVVSNPLTFADLIAWAYRPSDYRVESDDLTEEQRRRRANRAGQILFHLKRIPGLRDNGTVGSVELNAWIDDARKICQERGRGDSGDLVIGELLANSPIGADGAWPCEAVREVLERVQSSSMGRGFENGKHNLRGITSRGVFDGGEQERDLALSLRRDADSLASRWPFVAKLLRSLAKSYERQGRDEDHEAASRDLD
ncbi:MAG: hypothetical protein WEF50_19000 [Myxococcota bacterium]